ncbi:MAG: glycosyltransferase [Chitinophagaceae bacterium]
MKKVLYFFPLNPADRNSGSISRALGLLHYFRDRKMHVDFISKLHWGRYTKETIEAFENAGLADNLWVLRRKPVKTSFLHYFFSYKIKHILFERKLRRAKHSIPNHTTLHLRKQFDAILQKNRYDYIIISYAYWADLIRDNPFLENAVTIIDTHDLLTSQHQHDPGIDIGAALGDELKRVAQFDQIWAISIEETYFFKQFFPGRVHFITMMKEDPMPLPQDPVFDLIYVATHSPHNKRSIGWFLEKVYPLLPNDLRICIIGNILEHIPQNIPNITRIPFAEKLDDYYNQSRVVICPMLSGTGIKIKVVEAMAFGLPVVCTTGGVDGIPDKSNNGCLVTNDENRFAENIMLLLTNEAAYKKQSELGRACFKKYFLRKEVYGQLDQALNIKTV